MLHNIDKYRSEFLSVWHCQVVAVILEKILTGDESSALVSLHVRMGFGYGDHVVNAELENVFLVFICP